jgi:glycosyltransferase involved in cell wall biosynthesis
MIGETLDAVLGQSFSDEDYEIIVIDGASSDETPRIVEELIEKRRQEGHVHPVMTLLNNPGHTVPASMNMGIRQAKGEIIARVDGHAIIAEDYLSRCIEVLNETGASVVGGPIETIGTDSLSRTIALAMSTPYGVGNSAFRTSSVSQFTDTVPFGTFRKTALVEAGLFDERLTRHQDYEMNYRIRKNGGKIFLSCGIKSTYYARSNLKKLTKQYFQYGLFKGRVLHLHPASLKWRHTVPPVFVFCEILALILCIWFNSACLAGGILLTAYAGFLVFAALHMRVSGKKMNIVLFPLIIAIVHHSWGLGVLLGLMSPLNKPSMSKDVGG